MIGRALEQRLQVGFQRVDLGQQINHLARGVWQVRGDVVHPVAVDQRGMKAAVRVAALGQSHGVSL